jgi:glycosyltransferase involved in cell wall biosynthesis
VKASVVIPSYNGAKKIGRLLEALTKQTVTGFEVIVVIDGSTDDTQTVVKFFQDKLKDLRIILQQNSGRSVTRNRGAEVASGDMLIFYDDDMLPEPDSIAKHMTQHESAKTPIVLCGNILEIQGSDKSDIQNYKAFLADKWTARFTTGVNPLTTDNLFLTAANLSMPKKLFKDLNGFDERLTDIEDRELGFRILRKGIPAFFDKSNIAIHNDAISCKSYIARVCQYTLAQDKLKQLIPELPGRPYASGLKRIVLYGFSFGFWIELIDKEILIVHLPKRIRYKIYEWVIYAQGIVFVPNK